MEDPELQKQSERNPAIQRQIEEIQRDEDEGLDRYDKTVADSFPDSDPPEEP